MRRRGFLAALFGAAFAPKVLEALPSGSAPRLNGKAPLKINIGGREVQIMTSRKLPPNTMILMGDTPVLHTFCKFSRPGVFHDPIACSECQRHWAEAMRARLVESIDREYLGG